jgi:alanine-glyoxylate transaminase/serine-glyoxylate transaminase/serine-pyruvate transaminase
MTSHIKLFIPGPGDVEDEVLAESAFPVMRHYGPEWMKVHNETIALLRQIFLTQNDIYIVPGPASALLEMAIASLTVRGEKIIIGTNGFFGDRLIELAGGYGLTIIPFTAPLGKPLDPQVLRQLLHDHPETQVVSLVHHETGTCVMNPLRELTEVVHAAGKVLIADAVSSLGGVELPVDSWGIDVCVTAANKCLESLPGVGFISVNQRAWELVDRTSGQGAGWYLNLRTWRKYIAEWGTWHPSPVTLPSSIIRAARLSMRRIVSVGMEQHIRKYQVASQAFRKGMENMGFELFVPSAYASPIVTAVKARPEFTVSELSKWLLEERSIAIGGGLGPLSGKIFRVGHLGMAAKREYLLDFLFAVEEFLHFKGIAIPAGAGLAGLL